MKVVGEQRSRAPIVILVILLLAALGYAAINYGWIDYIRDNFFDKSQDSSCVENCGESQTEQNENGDEKKPEETQPTGSNQNSNAPDESQPADNSGSLSTDTQTYTVQSGDTLYGIALKFDTTVEIIQSLNDMGDSTLINVGNELLVPRAS